MRFAISIAAGLVAVVALVLAAVALALADDDGGGGSQTTGADTRLRQIEDSLDRIEGSLTSVQLVASLDALDGTGIHEFDEQTTRAASMDDIPAGYLADVRKIVRVVGAVSWPDGVGEEVQAVLDTAAPLEAALGGDDLTAIKAASPEFHLAWHSLREVGYQALAGEGPSTEEQHGQMDGGMEDGIEDGMEMDP